jgi:phage terminase large subunit-like protein
LPFSQPHADVACNFFERVLRHTADEWYGKPFLLTPWQEEGLTQIFGQLDDDGNRLVKMGYFEIPKKAGKTEWAAGIILFVLILDPNPGCQVYGAAAATRQAMNVYRAACKMVEQSALLRKRLRLLRGTNRIVKRDDPDSFYAAVAADGDLSDGVNPSFVVADELHRWRTRKQLENWDVLSLGGITRRQPLTIGITTAGARNESPLAWRLHEKTRRIQDGVAQDPSFVGRIYGATSKDDWTSEATWIRANPSLKERGGFLDISRIREKYESSLSDPESQSAFRRYYLNIWDQKENRVIDMGRWEASTGPWVAAGLFPLSPGERVRSLPGNLMARFASRPCWAGIDLSLTTDLTAVSFVFPVDDGGYDVLPFFWTPEDGIRKRELKDGMPYGLWVSQGFMEASPGNVIDYRDVKARLEWGAQVFDLKECCFDPWNSRQLSVGMVEDGYSCVEIRQGMMTLSEPSKKLLELVASGKLHHGGHPVLRWNASCLTAKEQNDNLMFAKPERSTNSSRIDGISATVNALARAMVAVPKKRSVYETRGIRTISLDG